MSEKRSYTLRERARSQEATRRRIVEATVALHEEVGPARTTVAEIARRAGVQRLTVYSHFPEDRELFAACSQHVLAANPPPDPAAWAAEPDPAARLRRALGELHAWYAAGEAMFGKVEADLAALPALREVVEAGRVPFDTAVRECLAAGRGARGRRRQRLLAALDLACGYTTWERLTRAQGLEAGEAVELLVDAVDGVARG
jgi:AcrR family transcriptional regulator